MQSFSKQAKLLTKLLNTKIKILKNNLSGYAKYVCSCWDIKIWCLGNTFFWNLNSFLIWHQSTMSQLASLFCSCLMCTNVFLFWTYLFAHVSMQQLQLKTFRRYSANSLLTFCQLWRCDVTTSLIKITRTLANSYFRHFNENYNNQRLSWVQQCKRNVIRSNSSDKQTIYYNCRNWRFSACSFICEMPKYNAAYLPFCHILPWVQYELCYVLENGGICSICSCKLYHRYQSR